MLNNFSFNSHLPPWASSLASCSFGRRKNMNCNDFKRDDESMGRSTLHPFQWIQTQPYKSKVGYSANPNTAGHAIRYPFDSSPHYPFFFFHFCYEVWTLGDLRNKVIKEFESWNQTEHHGRGLCWRPRCNQGETTHLHCNLPPVMALLLGNNACKSNVHILGCLIQTSSYQDILVEYDSRSTGWLDSIMRIPTNQENFRTD